MSKVNNVKAEIKHQKVVSCYVAVTFESWFKAARFFVFKRIIHIYISVMQ